MQVLIDGSSDTKNHAGFVPNNGALDDLWKIAISQRTKVSTNRGERSEFLGSSMEDCFLRGSGRMGWRQGMETQQEMRS